MSSSTLLALEPIVTWIKVEKPTFDLVGVVLGSFRLAGILLVLALGLGLLLGAALAARPPPAPPRRRSRACRCGSIRAELAEARLSASGVILLAVYDAVRYI